MTYFTTVTGDMPAQEMGHCQPHEHVYIVETPALLTHPELRLTNLAASIEELKLYRIAGGTTLVDANPLATGRDALALQEASLTSGVRSSPPQVTTSLSFTDRTTGFGLHRRRP